ncbi:sav-1 [Pristionchus pacificus]|uniref:Sav-1 n=1 Tax=Pristionchus pacificus TaxID=54126 RepID=A0A2A6CZV6_PRIPA|nr:sav-1 [Pristionchus pacificus]|eukprot:PDM83597.1 sav-1 [Pristionchus pacificus]
MLTRRKKQNAHTFLEGTSGSYSPRSVPPPIPICVSNVSNRGDPLRASPSPSPTTLLPKKPSLQSINSVVDGSTAKKASTQSLAPSVSSLVESGGYHLNGRSEPRQQPHKKAPSGQHPLSSHSFNYDRPRKVLAPSLSFSMLESNGGQYDRSETQLPPPHSQLDLRAVSVVDSPSSSSMETPLPQHRFVSTSLQHLPARSTMGSTSIIEVTGNDAAVAGNIPEEELELPPNWTVESIITHKQGTNEPVTLRYYVDHNTRRTHWLHPLVKEKLPAGWRKEYSHERGVVYHNDHLGTSQYDHPGLAKSAPSPMSAIVGHNIGLINGNGGQQPMRPMQQRNDQQQMQHHFNLIRDEEVPEWLRLYCCAPHSTDHLLDWKLFSLPKLEYYWALMYRLFRQDIIDAVRKKERLMLELQLEIARREQELAQSQSNQR